VSDTRQIDWRRLPIEELAELAPYMGPEVQREVAEVLECAKQDDIVARIRRRVVSHNAGPMYFLRNWTKTENYQWEKQGLQPLMPFPYKPHRNWWTAEHLAALPFPHDFTLEDPPDYLDVVIGFFVFPQTKVTLVPKTRQLMSSWLTVAFIFWHCQFFPAIEWTGQSENDTKCMGLVDYANVLYSNQEPWMKARFPLLRGEEGTAHRIEWAHASRFIGVPSGQRQFASSHSAGYFSDESAHQAAFAATLDIVLPAVEQVIAVSSAAPGAFGQMCESQKEKANE
jgi:hypothetical protein